jgi:hypothetical protein
VHVLVTGKGVLCCRKFGVLLVCAESVDWCCCGGCTPCREVSDVLLVARGYGTRLDTTPGVGLTTTAHKIAFCTTLMPRTLTSAAPCIDAYHPCIDACHPCIDACLHLGKLKATHANIVLKSLP